MTARSGVSDEIHFPIETLISLQNPILRDVNSVAEDQGSR